MNNIINLKVTSLLVICLTTACTGSRDWQASEAAMAGDPVAMWQDGQEAIRLGETQVSRGDERIQDGQREIREGESMVSEGNTLITRSREQYRVAARTSGGALTPEQLEDEAERLRRIASSWEEGLALINRGNRRINDGRERVTEGEAIVLRGQTLIESGRNLMQNSELMRRE
ncbi:MAG: hypothetical protein KJN90_09260 [Gammaproteobacteria bacterium]|nr:hypothetical protein [Gammaproteobacteria bacterium]